MERIRKVWEGFERYLIETRYAERDEKGNPLERSWEDIVRRFERKLNSIVSENFVLQKIWGGWGIKDLEAALDNLLIAIRDRYVIPASPALMTFGNMYTRRAGYFSCYPLGYVEDSMEGIYRVASLMKDVYMRGGGIGIDVSLIRPRGSVVDNGQGIASGPVSFLRLFDSVTGTTNQGGRRRGALLVQMYWKHKDIEEFITCKNIVGKLSQVIYGEGLGGRFDVPLQNMNISVVVDDEFFRKVREGDEEAVKLLDMMVDGMWKSGDPGFLFRHNMEEYSPFNWEEYGESHRPWFSNPCGEYLAPAMTACNLVTVNVAKIAYDVCKEVSDRQKRMERFLLQVFRAGNQACMWGNIVLFCDEGYPADEIRRKTQEVRPVGVGMTGLHSAMLLLTDGEVEYGDGVSCEIAKNTQLALCLGALFTSVKLGQLMRKLDLERYVYRWRKDYLERFVEEVKEEVGNSEWLDVFSSEVKYDEILKGLVELGGAFNSVVTSQAPTGSVSQFGHVGGDTGIEPMFDIELRRRVRDFEKGEWKEVVLVTEWLAEKLEDKEFRKKVEKQLAHNISPEGQLRVMEAVQKFCHTGISKTVNISERTTKEEIKELLYKAIGMRLKGFTIFRDGCRVDTVYVKSDEAKVQVQENNVGEVELEEEREARVFEVRGMRKVYVTVSFDREKRVREVFLNAGKAGSTVQGMLEGFGRVMSIALREHPEMLGRFVKTLEGIETGEWYRCKDMQGRSIPDMVAKILKGVGDCEIVENREVGGDLCLSCGKFAVVREGNCKSCKSCGWTTC